MFKIYFRDNQLNNNISIFYYQNLHVIFISENVSKTDPAYEIVIGAGGNTFSDIRRMQKSDVRHSVRLKGLLSALDPRFFWLHITKGN